MDHSLRIAYLNGYTQALNDLQRGARDEELSEQAKVVLMGWAFNPKPAKDPPQWRPADGRLWTDEEVAGLSDAEKKALGR